MSNVAAAPSPATPPRPAWGPLIAVLLVLAAAWWGSDWLARRARGAALPPLPDLSVLPESARRQVQEADALARLRPDSADALGQLGRAFHASLMSGEAIASYEMAEARDSASWQWTYLRGLLLEERGQIVEARDAFAAVTGKNPAHGLAWFRLAEIAFKQGALDAAEEAYVRASQAPPQPAYTAPGISSRRVEPLGAYARLGLVRVAVDRGRTSEALATLGTLSAAHPTFGPARTLRASIQRSTDEKPSPGRAYVPPADPALDAIVAQSTMRDLLLKHAAMAARGGDREWREYLVRRAAQFNPRDPNVLMEMAAMLQATGRATEALEILRQHEQLVPGDHHTLVEQGRCLADLGRLDEAEAVLRRAVRVRDAAAEYNLGTVLDREGRSDEARAHYERALEIDPFHSRALNNLGVWLDRHSQSEPAIATLRRAIQADPENVEAYSNLGSALIGARRLPEALQVLDQAVALDPEVPDAHNNRGIALAQSGRWQEAATEWERALQLNPNHVNARRNLDRLRALAR